MAKAPVKAQVRTQDNLVAYIAAAVVVCLAAIFLVTWTQTRNAHDATKPQVAYTKFGPYQIESQAFAMHVSLVVQTSLDDSSWPEKNRKDLDVVLKRTLANVDPKVIRSPNNLTKLQDIIVKACDATFNNQVVQTILITDFTYQARDEEG